VSGYRNWPAALLAVLGAVGATAVAVAEVTVPDGECAAGQDWATVSVVPGSAGVDQAVFAGYRRQLSPILATCLDVKNLNPLDPADVPDPRS